MGYLLDTNILLRRVNSNDQLHMAVITALQTLYNRGEQVYITPQNIIEFRSVATRPVANNGLGLSAAFVESEISHIENLFTMLPDLPSIYPFWKTIAQEAGVISKQVHDARMVAVCHAHGISNLLTFNDTHFRRFEKIGPGIAITNPHHL